MDEMSATIGHEIRRRHQHPPRPHELVAWTLKPSQTSTGHQDRNYMANSGLYF